VIGNTRFGIEITYGYDAPGLSGTLGAIRQAVRLLGERFLVLYGDTYLQIDYRAVAESWDGSGLAACMAVYRNEGRWGSSNAVYSDQRVVRYDKFSPTPDMTFIDYGLGGLTSDCLSGIDITTRDLADLYRLLAQRGQLFGYEADERFYEIGTPEALEETEQFLLHRTV
jgi:NDP-sugar pyrophosphorylase family protein